MIIKNLEDVKGTEREIKDENGKWVSRRLLLKDDNMGFSFHDTIVFAGSKLDIELKNNLEAVYCIEGSGEIEEIDTNKIHPITVGTLYALDKHDKHILRAENELRLICVFNPPLSGTEQPDK